MRYLALLLLVIVPNVHALNCSTFMKEMEKHNQSFSFYAGLYEATVEKGNPGYVIVTDGMFPIPRLAYTDAITKGVRRSNGRLVCQFIAKAFLEKDEIYTGTLSYDLEVTDRGTLSNVYESPEVARYSQALGPQDYQMHMALTSAWKAVGLNYRREPPAAK